MRPGVVIRFPKRTFVSPHLAAENDVVLERTAAIVTDESYIVVVKGIVVHSHIIRLTDPQGESTLVPADSRSSHNVVANCHVSGATRTAQRALGDDNMGRIVIE
jgi:hypothetical protein